MPFKKGQSGNPSGRPKITLDSGKTLRQLAREHTQEALDVLIDVMRASDAPWAAKVSAAQQIHDRGWGKPSQPVDGDGDGGPIKQITEIILRGAKADEG
jgi:hypothetical protein